MTASLPFTLSSCSSPCRARSVRLRHFVQLFRAFGTVEVVTSLGYFLCSSCTRCKVLVWCFAVMGFIIYVLLVLMRERLRHLSVDMSSLLSSISGCMDWRLP